MSKTNGTQVTRVCVWQLAVEAWFARTELPPKPEKDPIFSAYLRSQETPQVYRYLRRWLADEHGEAGLASFEDLARSLSEEVIMSRLKGKSLDDLTEIATRAQYAKRDLTKAFAAYQELLNASKTRQNESSSSPGEGGKVVRQARKASTAKPPLGGPGDVALGGSK